MGRKIAAVLTLLLVTGCAGFDLHIRKGSGPLKATRILIGSFEFRNMTFDPYVASEFREALKFEFFRRGIDAELIPDSENTTHVDSAGLQSLASKYSGDIIISGVISQREEGFLTDREIRSSITFLVYSGSGKEIGEGYYHTCAPASDEPVKRGAAERFVKELFKHIDNR